MSNTNVDHEEVQKFEQLATRWWDTTGEFRPLHDMNPARLDYIDECAHLSGKTVLDIGCGGGILSESMFFRGATVTGIDMGVAPLSVAKLHLEESNAHVHYEHISAEDFAQQHPHRFDVVTCMELLEHVPDPNSTIAACAELVKPGGHVFFSTLNRNAKSYFMAILGAEYVLKMLPKGTHDYKKFIRPSELHAWIRNNHLNLQDLKGVVYNPLTRTFKISNDVDVNYIACCTAQ